MSNIITTEMIRLHGSARNRDDAIREAGSILVESGAVSADYVDSMFDRESSVSTYMGNLLAIPHGTNDSKDLIAHSGVSVVRYDEAIDWGGNEVRFVVGIAGVGDSHLGVLGALATVFSDMNSVEKLLVAASETEVEKILGLTQA